MQTLEIVPRLMPEVRAGKKRHTIRWREAKIDVGAMRYVNSDDASDSVVVWVTEVQSMKLSAVAACLGMVDEWPDAVLLAGMREHYPGIQLDALVDVIHHLAPDASEQCST